MPFESCLPVRRFPFYKGQCHYIGQWWTATTDTLVGFESWLERDRLMLLDFDPDTVGLASQPYWLFWTTAEGRSRSHAPDYFARLADGTAIVLDCRPLDRIKPKDEVARFYVHHRITVMVLARDREEERQEELVHAEALSTCCAQAVEDGVHFRRHLGHG